MRVLLSAFAFSPYRGSEAAVGWNVACELAKIHEVTVITGAVRNAPNDYERYVREKGEVKGLTVEYVKPDRLTRLFDKLHNLPCLWALYYVAYRRWQWLAYKRALELHQRRPFDIAHHLTMIGYREPGYMWKLPIPFFWGPVGGNVNEPIAFLSIYSVVGKINVFLRNVINWVQKRVLIRPRRAAKHAQKIWAVTDADERTIRQQWGRDCERMIETAATPVQDGMVRTYIPNTTLRIVWSGTHTYGKALPILIQALARLNCENVQVDVLGRGPETASWQRMARRLSIEDHFHWHGFLSHDEALKAMGQAHVLVFTSVKEGTPHVVLEALSLGLPIICHDACGMGTVVNETCGIKVPMVSPEESILGFSKAISAIMSGNVSVERLSRSALLRAHELNWEEKARSISRAYKESVHE